MASGRLLRQLFRGYAKHDDATFRTVLENIIEEERAKNHRLLADDLERILFNTNGISSRERRFNSIEEVPKDKERGVPLIDIEEPYYEWERLILPPKNLKVLRRIAEEYSYRDVLASAGLKPKQRVLFYGPPGCGKTLAARVMAGVLSYPLAVVRFDSLVSSCLGETAANLRKVFDYVQNGQWVILFDEFDAIGKDRDSPFEHGELKRVVNTLLQLMDAYRGESLLIAATNHEDLLDAAIWRRFEATVHFDVPSQQDIVLLLRLFLKGFDGSKLDLRAIARRLKGATGADVELVTVEAARNAVLDRRSSLGREDFDGALAEFKDRIALSRSISSRENSGHRSSDVHSGDGSGGSGGDGNGA